MILRGRFSSAGCCYAHGIKNCLDRLRTRISGAPAPPPEQRRAAL